MRRGSWILAISGMMALHQNGYAADPVADPSSGRTAIGASRTGVSSTGRSAKKSAAEPRVKNYYKELFGEEASPSAPAVAAKPAVPDSAPPQTAAPAKGESTDWADQPDPAKSVTSAKAPAKKFAAKLEVDEPSLTDLPSISPKESDAASPRAKSKVSQAGYDRPTGKQGNVQQIRADGRPKSAPSLPEFDESAPKTTKSKSSKSKTQTVRDKSAAREEQVAATPAQTAAAPVASAPAQSGPVTSQVTLEWVKRGEFNVGQECQTDLIVKNTGTSAVSQIAVDAFFPTNVRLIAADPKPASATDRLVWTFDHLPAGGEQKLTVTMIPSRRGDIATSAQVRFVGASSASFAVQEPMLKVAIKSPTQEVMLGDPASQMITVTNPGTGTVHDVKVEAKLSAGLEHPTREDRLVIDVGAVGPGETRSYRLGLTAAKGGPQSVSVVATSSCDASSSDVAEFTVVAPSLKIAVDGPSLRYKGRNAKYTLTVTNDGAIVNNNVRISQSVAEGFKFVSADHNGKFDPAVNSVQWFITRLAPGESTQVACELNSLQIGEFAHSVQVVSDAGVQADARIETRVDGIASLTMELVDQDDPVEVGSETAYEIRVKNDGSKVASGVVIVCDMPAGMEFLSAKAPVEHVIEGRQLIFNPIDQIAPGDKVTIRVQLKVTRDGSHRMRARLTGGGLQEPMLLEEVTRAYTDGSN